MKKHSLALAALALLVFTGAGCAGSKNVPDDEYAPVERVVAYENDAYGFSFRYDALTRDAKPREDAVRETAYLGLPVDFFVSVRDLVTDETPLNIAFIYAAPDLSREAFEAALLASDPEHVEIISSEDVRVNGLTLRKIVSTTASTEPKTHYLWLKDEATLIFSVFIYQETRWEEILGTLAAR